MNKLKMIAAVALMAVTMSMANAQGMRMMGGGGGMSQGMVLSQFGPDGMSIRSDVSKELKLTDDQKTKWGDFQKKQMDEMMASFQPGGERPSQEEMQKMMKKRQEAEAKAIKEILDETQQKRLHELWIQRLGNGAIANADLQKDLGVTDEQKTKIKDLQSKQQEANQALFEKMRNGEIDRSEIQPIMEKNRKTLDAEYAKIMTDDQKAKLKTMGGTAFKFDEDPKIGG